MFIEFCDDIKFNQIKVGAIPYEDHPAQNITAEYLKKELQRRRLRIKDVQIDTKLETSVISALVNGIRPLSYNVKLMFYYYFLSKELEAKLKE